MPELQSKLIQEVMKENYDFGFATVGHEVYKNFTSNKRGGNRSLKLAIPPFRNAGKGKKRNKTPLSTTKQERFRNESLLFVCIYNKKVPISFFIHKRDCPLCVLSKKINAQNVAGAN